MGKSGHMRSCEANCTQKKTFPRFEEIGKATCDQSGPRGKKESGRDRAIDRLTGGDRSDQMQVRCS